MIFDQDSDDDCWMEIATPTIVSPTTGVTGVVFNLGVTITSSAMIPNLLGIALTSTEYEVSTSIGGAVQTGASTLNLSVIIPGVQLSANTIYFVRVRHRSGIYISPWSDYITFRTGAL